MKRKAITQSQYLLDIRESYVNKSNALIQKSRFSMTAVQQKILLTLISQIKPSDDEFKTYEFSLSEFLKLCGTDRGGNQYEMVKADIKALSDKSFWVTLYDEDRAEPVEKLLRWIDIAEIRPESNIVKLSLHRDMRPFLLHLKEHFTKYQLLYTMGLKSKYSIRLYELCCCIHYDSFKPYSKRFTVGELVQSMGADTYAEFRDFKRRALEPAILEINASTDKSVVCEYIKTGRTVTGIKLTISTKAAADRDKIRADLDRRFKVDEQQSLWIMMDNARGEQDE